MRFLLGFFVVFALGMLAGWLWRDAQQASGPFPSESLPGVLTLDQRGDLDDVVDLSGGDPEVVLQLIEGASSDQFFVTSRSHSDP